MDDNKAGKYIIGIDTGGTFTDIVVLSESGETIINKAPTTPHDFSIGVMDAVAEVAKSMGLTTPHLLKKTAMFKHSTTVATNALITRTGSKVGFITTKGFEDTTLVMRAIGRADGLSEEQVKHMTFVTKPEPIVPKALLKGISERIDFRGNVVVPINVDEAKEALRNLVEDHKVDAIAVSFLFGWMNPVHEKILKELAQSMYSSDRVYFTCSHELAPVLGEYARANTVIVDSFLGKTMDNYLTALETKLRSADFGGTLMIMQANGGIVHRDETTAVGSLQSGPAGGMIATSYVANLLGHDNVITTDMGGTSFDVGLVTGGYWHYAHEPIVQRSRILQPMIDVESIGAGGGTIARIDSATNRLLVGPRSAGASPGPVCYDAGGTEVTVTDADVVLGLIDPNYFLGGRRTLNKAKSEEAIRENIAKPLGIDTIDAAAAIYDIINSKMCDLIRKQVVRAGHIPEEYVIYSFGGAGPVHAAAYGGELGIKQIYVFPTSAVFSAFGAAAADVIHTQVNSRRYVMPGDPDELNEHLDAVEKNLYEIMSREGFSEDMVEFRRVFYMRYRRQQNEIGVLAPHKRYTADDIREIQRTFDRQYEETYGVGSAFTQAGSEIMYIHVDAIGRTVKPSLRVLADQGSDAQHALKGNRKVFFARGPRGFLSTDIYDYGKLQPGNQIKGPAIIETSITTVVVPPENSCRVDGYHNIIIEV